MMQQSSKLWARILDSKYGGWRSLAEGKRVNNESIWWQDLMKVTHEHQMNKVLQQETTWKVGCGDKIRFWEDKWSMLLNNRSLGYSPSET